VSTIRENIDALLRRAIACELEAERAADPADKAASLWFAAKYREKAAALEKQLSREE
jgi:hypothetical protein